MKASEAYRYAFIPPAFNFFAEALIQIKTGPGVVRYVSLWDDLGYSGSTYTVWDGVIGPPVSAGAPPTVSGSVMFAQAYGQLGPTCLTFYSGLVVSYVPNNAQCAGFVSYR